MKQGVSIMQSAIDFALQQPAGLVKQGCPGSAFRAAQKQSLDLIPHDALSAPETALEPTLAHDEPVIGCGEGEGDLVTVQVQDGSEAQVPALILSAQQAAGGRRQQAKCGWGGRQGKAGGAPQCNPQFDVSSSP